MNSVLQLLSLDSITNSFNSEAAELPTSIYSVTPNDVYDFTLVDFTKQTFWLSFLSIAFAPLFWNIVGRIEYKTHFLTKIFFGNKYAACYFLAAIIFFLQIERDWSFNLVLYSQPYFVEATSPFNQGVSLFLFTVGSTLVLAAFWQLGITGTYLGDYFGILMSERITGFPFNMTNSPMYLGSFINILASSIWRGSPAGLVLAFWSHIVYTIATIYFEDPFTGYIYEQKALADAKKDRRTNPTANHNNNNNNKKKNNKRK